MIIAITAREGKSARRREETRTRGIIQLYNDTGPSYRRRRFHCRAAISHPLCRNEQTEGWRRTENGYTDWPPAEAAVNILSPSRRGDGGRQRRLRRGLAYSPPHTLIHPPLESPFFSHLRGNLALSCHHCLSTGPPTASHPYELKPDLMGWKRAARSSCIQLSLLSVLQPHPNHL